MNTKTIRFISLGFLGLAANLGAAPVGDFSPLSVGNLWVYSGSYRWNDDIGRSGGYLSQRTVGVISSAMLTDTTSYRVAIRDSLYRRILVSYRPGGFDTVYYRDSVIYYETDVLEFSDSTLKVVAGRDAMINNYAFRSHRYEDSLIANQNYGSQTFPVYHDSSGTFPSSTGCQFNYSKRTFLKDVGIGRYESGQAACVGGTFYTYDLIRFNNLLVTGLRRAGNKNPGKMESPSHRFKNRTVLGRKHFKH